jgi:hypothetical protein
MTCVKMMTLPLRQPIRISELKCAECMTKESEKSFSGETGQAREKWEMLKGALSPVSPTR